MSAFERTLKIASRLGFWLAVYRRISTMDQQPENIIHRPHSFIPGLKPCFPVFLQVLPTPSSLLFLPQDWLRILRTVYRYVYFSAYAVFTIYSLWCFHFSVVGSVRYSLSHSQTLWWRVRWLKQCRLEVAAELRLLRTSVNEAKIILYFYAFRPSGR